MSKRKRNPNPKQRNLSTENVYAATKCCPDGKRVQIVTGGALDLGEAANLKNWLARWIMDRNNEAEV